MQAGNRQDREREKKNSKAAAQKRRVPTKTWSQIGDFEPCIFSPQVQRPRKAGGSSKFLNRRILWRGMRKDNGGALGHDAIRRIFSLLFPEACGQTHGPGRLKALPLVARTPLPLVCRAMSVLWLCYPQASHGGFRTIDSDNASSAKE